MHTYDLGADGRSPFAELRGFASFQDLVRLSAAKVPQSKDGGQMLDTRACFALFPVVDGLS